MCIKKILTNELAATMYCTADKKCRSYKFNTIKTKLEINRPAERATLYHQ